MYIQFLGLIFCNEKCYMKQWRATEVNGDACSKIWVLEHMQSFIEQKITNLK